MTPVLIFGLVYLGMILGGLPGLQLDRTDIALLGAIAVIGSESLSVDAAARSIHLPTLILLFSFMVVSAQMRLGGFYDRVTERVAALPLAPPALLAALVALIGVLSAVFTNDVVCLAVAPVLIGACRRRSLDPVPFLLALAAAANVGSAATLIGNPQNMLIGQKLGLSFAGYAATAAPPVVAGLIVTWGLVALGTRRRWTLDAPAPAAAAPAPYDRWQSAKGLAVAAG
ncbi:MAG: anion transporter, partial [Burkholderiales bacterium]|nr:anion transporter [Burkholderiales bacterium]